MTPLFYVSPPWGLPRLYDVTAYGAKGDGTTDDTAAINAALSAIVAAGGGTLYLPANHLISSTIQVGNGTNTTRSVPISIVGTGGLVEAGNQSSAAGMSALRAPTTLIASSGFTGTTLLQINGPGEFGLADVLFQCAGNVTNGVVAYSLNKSSVRRCMVLQQNGGVGWYFRTNDSYTGAFGDEYHGCLLEQVHNTTSYDNSTGCIIGSPADSLSVNISFWTLMGCDFNLLNITGTSQPHNVGLQFQYCDNICCVNTIAEGAAGGVKVAPPSGTGGIAFPSGLEFFHLSAGGGLALPSTAVWNPGIGGGLTCYAYQTDNQEPIPPWDSRITIYLEDGRLWANARTSAPYVTSTGTAAIQNTTTETAISQAQALAIPAGALNIRGAVVRMRLSGRYNCSGTSGLTVRLRAYLDSISAGNLLYDSGALALGTARTNEPWQAVVQLGVVNTGTAGQFANSDGFFIFENTCRSFNVGTSGATTSFDMTAAHTVVWTAQWSLAETADSFTTNLSTIDVAMPAVQPAF